MIELIATVESLEQAEAILPYVDTIYFGEEAFGLRLPNDFSREEQAALTTLAHEFGKKVQVAVNGIMHPAKMKEVPDYLRFLKTIGADSIVVGDPGIIYVMNHQADCQLPFVYDGETVVTNARQINFWHKKGAQGAVLAREVPFAEMKQIATQVEIPAEVLVYGATCIHHSKRPLLQNYYNFTEQAESVTRERGLFISEPKKDETHYSIYEDEQGTHIFANNDICLVQELEELATTGYRIWKLDGVFTPGEAFVAIVKQFDQARLAIEEGTWDATSQADMATIIRAAHPKERQFDTGFFYLDPAKIK